MRKIIILLTTILTFSMMTVYGLAAFGTDEETFYSDFCTITKITDEAGVRIILVTTNTDPAQEIALIINDDTVFLDNETRKSVDFGELKEKDRVIAFYSAKSTKSNPPQASCAAIVINLTEGKARAKLMEVAEITATDDGNVKFLNKAGDYLITVAKDTPVSILGKTDDLSAKDIKEGDIVFTWFLIAALSYPAQAGTDAVLIVKQAEAVSIPPVTAPPADLIARPIAAKVLVNGKEVSFDAYNVDDNNYFKLRDLAYILAGTDKQFDISYDQAGDIILLKKGEKYKAIGGEMVRKGEGNKTPVPTKQKIYLDNEGVSFTAYNIGGNNYFRLRDVGGTFDFGVDWDSDGRIITIDTNKGYTSEDPRVPSL